MNSKSLFHILFTIFLCSCQSNSTTIEKLDDNRAFPQLLEIIDKHNPGVKLYIDENLSTIFNEKLKDLSPENPLYTNDDCESEMTLLAVTSIDNSSEKYAILYGFCPEPEFHIYSDDDLTKFYGSISGQELYLNGNGFMYSAGHVNSNFNVKRKLKFDESSIIEIEQPNYYVGLKTKTLKPINLYKTKDMKSLVASLPINYDIEVLLAETSHENDDFYLIRTDFGLVGWTKIKSGQYQSIDIEGIFWNGD